jgi:membrane protease YdiL (CAAX protease family)
MIMTCGTIFLLLFIVAGSFLFGTGFEEMLVLPPEGTEGKGLLILKFVQASQHLAFFIIPGCLILYIMRIPGRDGILGKLPDLRSFIVVILLALFIIPVTSYTGILNSGMDLPDWLSSAEEWMKQQEDNASLVTGMLVEAGSVQMMIGNLIILAVLPAAGEEMIFRGVIQRLLCRIFRRGDMAVWLAAFIFSAMHFQFYGFIPRFILGLVFGYLFYWTGNLWLPVTAHFVNNAVTVISSWAEGWEEVSEQSRLLAEHALFLPLAAAGISLLLLFYFRDKRTV